MSRNSQKTTDNTEERGPVIRPRASREELAKLHPIERVLYRCFEFMASVKLAVVLMIWLMVECAIGTQIESTMDASAAKYFVYSNIRFYILLALLALNVLFAALIRFPWKRYQIGFLVTHTGLLVMLGGAMLTAINNVDSLLIVPQDKVSDRMVFPDQQVLHFALEDAQTGRIRRQAVPVNFGPLTWGTNILGVVPWGKNSVQEIALDELGQGTKARVTRYIANCDAREMYVPAEKGTPAVEFTLAAPDFRFMATSWLKVPSSDEGLPGAQELRIGGMPIRARIWRLSSQDELDHFVQAVPKGPIEDTMGVIGFSCASRHHLLPINELQKHPFESSEENLKVEFVDYLKNAVPDPASRGLKSEGDLPKNPAVKLRVTRRGQTSDVYALADFPELTSQLSRVATLGDDVFVTFFRADQPTEIQLAVTLGEQLGYRAFAAQGCVASVVAELGQSYPSFGMFEFTPEKVLASASAKPTMQLIPLPAPNGRPPLPGIEIEVKLPDGTTTTERLICRVMPAQRVIGNRLLRIDYEIESKELPFAIRLDDFNEPKQPGTMDPAKYESFVTVLEKKEIPKEAYRATNPMHLASGGKTYELHEIEKAEIKMNHPLFFAGADGKEYTLFQSGIDRSSGTPVSTFTVSYDPGLLLKYAGLVIIVVGIILMFYMGGYFRSRRPAKEPKDASSRRPPTEEESIDEIMAVRV